MIWKGMTVSLGNYRDVFRGFPKETLEVIRGALFDCTPIEPYIVRFSDDPYKLWEVKLCLDEGVDKEWFDICPSGNTLYSIRMLKSRGINISPLKRIMSEGGLNETYFNYIIKWYEKGISLDRYNFGILPEDLLSVFDYGISLGYPMYIFNNGVHFKYEYIIACLRLLSNGKNVNRFLDGEWDLANISLLAKYSKSKYYDNIIEYITKLITPSVLEEIYKCCKVGLPIKDVSVVDEDGIYVFSGVHIALAREAFLKKLDYKKILNTDIGIMEATSILSEMELNASKKVSGRLRKNDF